MEISAQVGAKIDLLAWPSGEQADQVDDIRPYKNQQKHCACMGRVRVVYGN